MFTTFKFQDYFNRNWKELRTGFGDPEKEFWLGLDKVYKFVYYTYLNILFYNIKGAIL